jgi:hypothetical protein
MARQKHDEEFRRLFQLFLEVRKAQNQISQHLLQIGAVLDELDFDTEEAVKLTKALANTFPHKYPDDKGGPVQ